jgi:cell division protein FtsB
MSKIKEKQVTIELLKAENEALLKENEKLELDNTHNYKLYEKASMDKRNIAEELRILKKAGDELFASSDKSFIKLQNENEELKKELNLLKENDEQLFNESHKSYEKVLIENKKLKEEMGKNHESFLIMSDDCLKLQSENNKLKPKNKQLKEEIEKLKTDRNYKELYDLQCLNNDALDLKLETLEEVNAELKNELSILIQENKKIEACYNDLREVHNNRAELCREIEKLKEDVQNLIKDEKETFRKYEVASKYNFTFQEEIKKLNDEIEEIHNYLDLLPHSPRRFFTSWDESKDGKKLSVLERLFSWFANNKN